MQRERVIGIRKGLIVFTRMFMDTKMPRTNKFIKKVSRRIRNGNRKGKL